MTGDPADIEEARQLAVKQVSNPGTATRVALVVLSVLTVVLFVGGAALWEDNHDLAESAQQQAEAIEHQADKHCTALDDIHRSLVSFVREHHQITVDLRAVGVEHEQVPLRETLQPLRVECRKRDFENGPPLHGESGHDHSQDHDTEGGGDLGPGDGGGSPGGGEPPSDQPEPDQPGLADPVTDPLYEETGIECHVDVAGVPVCSSPPTPPPPIPPR